MKGLNQCTLMGYTGSDPEVKTIGTDGKKVAKFSLATTEKFKNRAGETVEETEWHNIVAWGATAEFIEKYVKKGKPILVNGKIKNRSYDGKDGVKRYVTEIIVNEIIFLPSAQPATTTQPVNESPQSVNKTDDDDLPF